MIMQLKFSRDKVPCMKTRVAIHVRDTFSLPSLHNCKLLKHLSKSIHECRGHVISANKDEGEIIQTVREQELSFWFETNDLLYIPLRYHEISIRI